MPLFKICLLLYIWNIAEGQRTHFTAIFSEVDCQHNPEFISRVRCSVDRTRRYFNSELIFKQDIAWAMSNYTVQLSQRTGQVIHQFSAKIEFCKLLNQKSGNALIAFVRDALGKHSNIPRRCPFKKNEIFHFDNFTMDANNLPRFVPEANFVVYSTYYSRAKEIILQAKFEGHTIKIN